MLTVRTLVYEGNAKWVKSVLEKSYLSPINPLILPRGSVRELDRKIYETKEEYDRDYSSGSSGGKSSTN